MISDQEHLKNERILIAAIRAGQSNAWGSLYDMYAQRLYRSILMPRLTQTTAAEDALSETFRTAIERLDSFEDQGHGIYPWLCRIAHNKAMDFHRVSRVSGRKVQNLCQLLAPLTEPVQGAEDLLAHHGQSELLANRLKQALEQINPRYRRVLELRFLQELGRTECAEVMEVKQGTFDVLLLRALKALRTSWQDLCPPSSGGAS